MNPERQEISASNAKSSVPAVSSAQIASKRPSPDPETDPDRCGIPASPATQSSSKIHSSPQNKSATESSWVNNLKKKHEYRYDYVSVFSYLTQYYRFFQVCQL